MCLRHIGATSRKAKIKGELGVWRGLVVSDSAKWEINVTENQLDNADREPSRHMNG